MRTTEHAVVIAGGGPTGMMLAAELTLANVDVAIVERRPDAVLLGSRAGGFHTRTIEVLDQRGVADRFLSEGTTHDMLSFGWIPLGPNDFPSRHPYTLGLWQVHIERIMAAWIDELGVPVHRGREVTGFTQDRDGVSVQVSDGEPLRARYLVGCDGGRSVVRKSAGIDFPGVEASTSTLIAEVLLTEEPEWGVRRDATGIHGLNRLEGDDVVRVVISEAEVEHVGEPSLADLSAALVAVYGTDYGVHSPAWISRFTDMTRQAAAYRQRRVLLAGDAAHVHSPVGGQGLGTGVQDAVNLGWKLAQVVHGVSPEELLDTYHAERHPVAAKMLRNTLAQTVLLRSEPRVDALRETLSELLSVEQTRRRFGAMQAGVDIHYDLGDGHPLLGRRMPDLDLTTPNGPLRLYALLHDARPVLLNLARPLPVAGWSTRIKVVDAAYDGVWELPVIGVVDAPAAALIRPDGHVAWVGDGSDAGLANALLAWFGPPVVASGARSTT